MSGVLNQAFDQPLKLEEKASIPLAGGIMQNGYQCGMIWGASLAAGAEAFRLFGASPKTEVKSIHAAKKLVESFRDDNKHVNCFEITNLDKSSSAMDLIKFFLIKGGTIGCMRMAARYAPMAFNEINLALSDEHIEPPTPPLSCATMVAKKMGATDKHIMMASGFAGGIGLFGGACGALGTAIWINGMDSLKEPNGKINYNDPKAIAIVEKFLKYMDYKFECSEIVGRKFDNINDHASYLKEGGCSEIIEILSTA